mmetsp:Transcript_664/g.1260  ORF Transcript_664/g.1260 Transcript_664/m.1260 type:complete len:235 (+) Transcript_664:104-808(+)
MQTVGPDRRQSNLALYVTEFGELEGLFVLVLDLALASLPGMAIGRLGGLDVEVVLLAAAAISIVEFINFLQCSSVLSSERIPNYLVNRCRGPGLLAERHVGGNGFGRGLAGVSSLFWAKGCVGLLPEGTLRLRRDSFLSQRLLVQGAEILCVLQFIRGHALYVRSPLHGHLLGPLSVSNIRLAIGVFTTREIVAGGLSLAHIITHQQRVAGSATVVVGHVTSSGFRLTVQKRSR